MFQPTHYRLVADKELEEWERTMAEQVGLKAKLMAATGTQMMPPRGISWSGCSWEGGGGWDECDV
jgi:hypothetical protein